MTYETENKKVKLIPAIVQDYKTGEVLMLGYMSKESLKKSIETGTTWFWSRERKKLWKKGETSGNIQKIVEIDYDCDGDALLIKVEQIGNACHTGNKSCFYRSINLGAENLDQISLDELNFFYECNIEE
ncbi:MAG: phosphoribosyl-AMP cyclohydrolase [Actinobacteria bacterium]|nr:phosphoribosyl-AMP cyclohydrolase [Actinomycetota bacterium]